MKKTKTASLILLLVAGAFSSGWSQVPAGDITSKAPIADNLPVFSTLAGYDTYEAAAAAPNRDTPLYAPFDPKQDVWWDNMLAELSQARLVVHSIGTRGCWNLNPVDETGPGNMNPRMFHRFIDAINRSELASSIKVACFVDAPAVTSIYQNLHGLPSGTPLDMSVQSDWIDIWWLRVIKPWFESVPQSMWYKVNGKPRIEFWGIGENPKIMINVNANWNQMLATVEQQFLATYGVSPVFLGGMHPDPSQNIPALIGNPTWFAPPNLAFRSNTYNGYTVGGMCPGYIDPEFFIPGHPKYQNYNRVVRRNGITGTGANGDTMRSALESAYSVKAHFTLIEGWNGVSESCGLYRAQSSALNYWDYSSQYINILRQYTDLRTHTLRLEAEGCDIYVDTTSGNSGGSFLRSGEDLDVRALVGQPAISASSANNNVPGNAFDGAISTKWYTPTTAPGWIRYDFGDNNATVVTSYIITSGNDVPQRDPRDWQFQGSNDGSNWTTLDTKTNQTFAARLQNNTYAIPNTTAYRYYRLNITANAGGSGYGIQLAELTLRKAASSKARGWVVTNTAAGESIQFEQVFFSAGNYKFPIKYSSTSARNVQLYIDGTPLPAVQLPSSGNMNTFTTAYLGSKALSHGAHTLKLVFIDGGVDVDWLFIKKYDTMMSFKSSLTNCYLTAEKGGNNTASNAIVSNRTVVGAWEQFSINSATAGGVVNNGDTIKPQVWNGCYMNAPATGPLQTDRRTPGGGETYTIVKLNGSGAINAGDQVAIMTNAGKYVTVYANGSVDATGTSVGTAQTFAVETRAP